MDAICQFEQQDDGSHLCRVCGLRAPAVAVRPVANCFGPSGWSPQALYTEQPPAAPAGPGSRLKALLRDWLGIEASPTCRCNGMAAKMDALGPDWCESDEGMSEILGVMRDEHARRRAEGLTVLPWADFAARRLVLLACRQARDAAKNPG